MHRDNSMRSTLQFERGATLHEVISWPHNRKQRVEQYAYQIFLSNKWLVMTVLWESTVLMVKTLRKKQDSIIASVQSSNFKCDTSKIHIRTDVKESNSRQIPNRIGYGACERRKNGITYRRNWASVNVWNNAAHRVQSDWRNRHLQTYCSPCLATADGSARKWRKGLCLQINGQCDADKA